MKRFCLLSFFLLFTVTGWSQQRISALFVGNSYTFFNDMPEILEQIATSLGDTLVQKTVVANRYSFEKHYKDTVTLSVIASQQFDRIILQEWHVRSGYPANFFEDYTVAYADSLLAYIGSHQMCARPYLFMPWARETGNIVDCPSDPTVCTYEGMRDRIFQNFHHLRQHTGLPVAPVGAVWDHIRLLYPWLDMYNASDRHHPNLAGSYLAACVHYVMLYRKSPVGGYYPPAMQADIAALLQQEAWLLMQDLQPEWEIDLAAAPSGGIGVEKLNTGIYRFSPIIHDFDDIWWTFSDGATSNSENPVKTVSNSCPLTARMYVVTKCDTAIFERVVRPAGAMRAFATVTHPTCLGLNNGKIAVLVDNAVGNLQFQWSSGQTTPVISSLTHGSYAVTVTDASGCTDMRMYNLTHRRKIVPTYNVVPECSGQSNAQIRSTAKGGYPPYTYQWSSGVQAANLSNLTFGNYSVTVQDSRGCISQGVVTVDSGSVCKPTELLWADQITQNSMVIKWKKVPCALSYRLEYRLNDDPDALWILISINSLTDTFLLTGLTQATTYQVRLRSRCSAGDWLYDDSRYITTLGHVLYYDGDRDGFGQDSYTIIGNYVAEPNLSLVAGDCDDSKASVNPTAIELCDQLDNNCNGQVDEPQTTCPIPESPIAVQVTANTALMAWESGTCDLQYRIRYKLVSDVIWASTLLPSGQMSYLITGYSEGDEINCSLQRICNTASFSTWSITRRVILTDEPFVTTTDVDVENLAIPENHQAIDSDIFDAHVWPNPANKLLNIRWPDPLGTDSGRQLSVKIYSSFGIFAAVSEQAATDGHITLNIEHLPAGLYYIQIDSGDAETCVRTFIKSE